MSNETDLDWLARNVHGWHGGKGSVLTKLFGHGVWIALESCHDHYLTLDQYLSRRAELQNKPSFADHPDAKCFVQNHKVTWYKNTKSDNVSTMSGGEWRNNCMNGGWQILDAGEVLGDWRDTLEKRPEELKPSIEEANRMAQDFKPFTSIEDNQEKDMKQDNRWCERGELPPVGTVCLYVVSDHLSAEVEITAHAKLGLCFVEVGKSGENYVSKTAELHRFRPIRTERDELIEIIASNLSGTTGQVADAILAAGFKLEQK